MTKLVYMEDFDVVQCEAIVNRTEDYEGKLVVVLDKTCFYPKGGGQDFDLGKIVSTDAEFVVEAVFFVDGEVKHVGNYIRGSFKSGDIVDCQVDQERRSINTRLHSAGHTLDMAVRNLGWDWHPGKGAHYPHMSFVEYSGELDAEKKEELRQDLQEIINDLISKGSRNTISFMTPEEMRAAGAIVPDNLPTSKPSRAVLYDSFVVPCGGTHVADIKDIGIVLITKIKMKDGNIRVSYSIS